MTEPVDYHDTCHHRNYHLTCDDFDALWDRSQGCCEICGKPERETKGGRLYIEHHGASWHLVRGLVCERCNAAMRRVDEGRPEYVTPETTRFAATPFHARFCRPIVPIKATRAWQAKAR